MGRTRSGLIALSPCGSPVACHVMQPMRPSRRTSPASGPKRHPRSTPERGLVEFGAKGFDGASTRAIAARVGAHQPQIHYHFESKAALWTAAVDYLFGLLREAMADVLPTEPTNIEVPQLAAAFADGIRRFVAFAARHPELNQILVHEGTADSERLKWMTHTHVKPLFEAVSAVWPMLRDAGCCSPSTAASSTTCVIGGASIPYVNAPEVRLSPDKIHNPPPGSPRTQMRSSPSCYPESPTTRPGRRGRYSLMQGIQLVGRAGLEPATSGL